MRSIKSMLMSPEVMLHQFLKIYNVPKNEYRKDLHNFEEKIADMRSYLTHRVIYGVDTYPYIYILYKLAATRPGVLHNMLLYFSIMMKRHNVCTVGPTIAEILSQCDDSVIFVYFMAVLQYYLL